MFSLFFPVCKLGGPVLRVSTCVREGVWCRVECCEVGEGNAIAIIMIQTCLVELVEGDRYEDSEGTRGRGEALGRAG